MNITSVAKYIDQPLVINNLQKTMPAVVIGGAGLFGVYNYFKTEPEKRKTQAIKDTIVLGSTVTASLIGARGLKVGNTQILKALMPLEKAETIIVQQAKAVEKYLKDHGVIDKKLVAILEKAKSKSLNPNEIQEITTSLPKGKGREELFSQIFSPQEELTSQGIFKEMKRLPWYGAYAVGGGLAGGIVADKVTGTGSKKSYANKVKEACYQYCANVLLCIVGAGAALFGLEKLEKAGVVKNPSQLLKLGTVIAGILGVGVIFGSIAANLIGKKVINPMFGEKEDAKCKKSIYSERKPEVLDIAMHADDLATAGIYSGFRWIEAVLPALYIMAGYRAGMGYRNNHHCHGHHRHHHKQEHHRSMEFTRSGKLSPAFSKIHFNR